MLRKCEKELYLVLEPNYRTTKFLTEHILPK